MAVGRENNNHLTRREFLGRSALGVAGAGTVLTGLQTLCSAAGQKRILVPPIRSTVIKVKDNNVISNENYDIEHLRSMINTGVKTLTRSESLEDAWKSMFEEKDRVGIKINTEDPRMRTNPLIVDVIIDNLKMAGVKTQNIIVWDKTENNMELSGYNIVTQGDGPYYYASDTEGVGYERTSYYSSEFLDDKRSYFTEILTQRVDKVINVPVLKDHNKAGITCCLMSMALGSLNDDKDYGKFPYNYDPFVAEIYSQPPIYDKTVLHICDAIRPCYNGGPIGGSAWSWDNNTLYISKDPVALDQVALELIKSKRIDEREPSFEQVKACPIYITSAAKIGLGNNVNYKVLTKEIDQLSHTGQ